MTDTLVAVENVSKKFCRSLKRSLWYGVRDLGNELVGRRIGGNGELRPDEFWAVRDVGFELRRGECLGLIGHNGAGKTTLLRMLNGLIKPDQGRIEIRGRVGALIALGAGFHPLLTGRENIHVNAAVLGLSRGEINQRFGQIVEFSGLSDFIDSPVQNYSSGMYMRLGFSIAAHVHPDILLVDEALAVGDIAFVVKCLNKVAELRRNGTGIIFVSHNELQMREAAERCIVLSEGRVIGEGDPGRAFFLYEQARTASHESPDTGFVHDGPVRISQCMVGSSFPQAPATSGEPLRLTIRCESTIVATGASLELRFWNAGGQVVTSIDSLGRNNPINLSPGACTITIDIASLALVPGRYRLAGGFRWHGEVMGWSRDLACIDVAPPAGMQVSQGFFIMPAIITVCPALTRAEQS